MFLAAPKNCFGFFKALKSEGIGVNVHYMPIHLHSYYKNNFNTYEGMLPISEKVYKQIIIYYVKDIYFARFF